MTTVVLGTAHFHNFSSCLYHPVHNCCVVSVCFLFTKSNRFLFFPKHDHLHSVWKYSRSSPLHQWREGCVMAENVCLFFSPLPLLHFHRHSTYWQGNVWNRRLRWQTKKAHNLFISDSRFIFHTLERPDSELRMHGLHFPSCLYIRVMYSVPHRTENEKKQKKKKHNLVAFQGSFTAPKFGDDLPLCCWSCS